MTEKFPRVKRNGMETPDERVLMPSQNVHWRKQFAYSNGLEYITEFGLWILSTPTMLWLLADESERREKKKVSMLLREFFD
jgi:hypothetical protein